MQALLKILTIFAELLQRFVDQRAKAKRDEKINDIQNDPAGEFINELVACESIQHPRVTCQPIKPVLTSVKKNSDDGISLNRDDTAALMFYITQLQECTGV